MEEKKSVSIEPLKDIMGFHKWKKNIILELGRTGKTNLAKNVLVNNEEFEASYGVVSPEDTLEVQQMITRSNKMMMEDEAAYPIQAGMAVVIFLENMSPDLKDSFLATERPDDENLLGYMEAIKKHVMGGMSVGTLHSHLENKISHLKLDPIKNNLNEYYNRFMEIKEEMTSIEMNWSEERYQSQFLAGLSEFYHDAVQTIAKSRTGDFDTLAKCYGECRRHLSFMENMGRLKQINGVAEVTKEYTPVDKMVASVVRSENDFVALTKRVKMDGGNKCLHCERKRLPSNHNMESCWILHPERKPKRNSDTRCYECNSTKHLKRDCPNLRRRN